MKHSTPGLDLHLFVPDVYGDNRGFFYESFHVNRYRECGLMVDFVQDNISSSTKGVLRGLHFQHPYGQGKLISVLEGEVFDVAVDVRIDSPTFGASFSIVLDGKSKKQLFIPEGYAHGFVVLSDYATFMYKCTSYYQPQFEHTLLWEDQALKINWPIDNPLLSTKDKNGLSLNELKKLNKLPQHNNLNSG
jgi:dTDP-4-dehydrorhamnose 3,5-epimerase